MEKRQSSDSISEESGINFWPTGERILKEPSPFERGPLAALEGLRVANFGERLPGVTIGRTTLGRA